MLLCNKQEKKQYLFTKHKFQKSSNLHGIRALGFRSGEDSSSTVSYLANGRCIRRANTANPNVIGTDGTDVSNVPETPQSNQPN